MITLRHIKNDRMDCFVHSDGRVYTYHSVWRKFVLHKAYVDSDGYVRLSIQGKNIGLHQILAMAFIDNPNNLPTVDHIDRNRSNNALSNLRWASIKLQNQNKEHHKLDPSIKKANDLNRGKALRASKREQGLCYLKRNGKWGWYDKAERCLTRGNRYISPVTSSRRRYA